MSRFSTFSMYGSYTAVGFEASVLSTGSKSKSDSISISDTFDSAGLTTDTFWMITPYGSKNRNGILSVGFEDWCVTFLKARETVVGTLVRAKGLSRVLVETSRLLILSVARRLEPILARSTMLSHTGERTRVVMGTRECAGCDVPVVGVRGLTIVVRLVVGAGVVVTGTGVAVDDPDTGVAG